MELEQLDNGTFIVQKVHRSFGSQIQLAQDTDGKWYALNYRSMSPTRLRNREQRVEWARVQGIPAKDVENFVRRAKAEEARIAKADQIQDSIRVLKAYGLDVSLLEKQHA
jgi:hypothetical protein